MPILPAAEAPASPPIKTHAVLPKPKPCYSLPMNPSGGAAAFNCLHDASRPLDITVLGISVDSALTTITCALCRFRQHSTASPLFVELCSYRPYPLDQATAQHADRIIHTESTETQRLSESAAQLSYALSDARLGHLFADAAKAFCKHQDVDMAAINAISLQGQPLRPGCRPAERAARSALTLAEASVLAQHTGATCISNLVSSEPFVTPSASLDTILLRHPSRTRLCQYIGRSHTSYCLVPAGSTVGHLNAVTEAMAEPGSSLIDDVVRHYTHGELQSDKDGEMGTSGTVDSDLADRFLCASRQTPTDDTSKPDASVATASLQSRDLIERAVAAQLSANDAVATATHIVAQSILAALTAHAPAPYIDEILTCGGGARNPNLVGALASAHPRATVAPLETVGLPKTARAAAATAWRGVEALVGRVTYSHIIPGHGYRTVTRGAMAFGGPAEDLPPVREAIKIVNDAAVAAAR